jgi:hypothetical protein
VENFAPLEERFAGYDTAPGGGNWSGQEDHCGDQEFLVNRHADIPVPTYGGT